VVSAKHLIAGERRSFGWDYLAGDAGATAESALSSFADFIERLYPRFLGWLGQFWEAEQGLLLKSAEGKEYFAALSDLGPPILLVVFCLPKEVAK
jgi:hypothetical protein